MAVSDKRTLISFSCPSEVKEKATLVAKTENRSLSNLIVTALLSYINNVELDNNENSTDKDKG